MGAAIAVRDRQFAVPYRRLAVWCAVLVLVDVADLWLAARFGNNLWTVYFTLPIEVLLTLWIMAAWQPSPALRPVYATLAVLVLLAPLAVVPLADPYAAFIRWISPALAVIALISVVHTLVGRSLMSRSHLTSHGWFWVCMGMAIFWTGFITVPIFADMFVETAPGWVLWAYIGRAWVNVGAFLIIAWGVLCPRIQTRSSGSS